MSLRLDPKYHGVRVARVRPKYSAIILGPISTVGYVTVGKITFRFRLDPLSCTWTHRALPAYGTGLVPIWELKDALKAIGLR